MLIHAVLIRCLSLGFCIFFVGCSEHAPAKGAENAPLVIDGRVGEPCRSKPDPVETVICDAELRLADARERRDVVRLLCYDDKLSRLRDLASTRMRAQEKLKAEPGPPAGEVKHLKELVAVTEERISGTWKSLDACASEYPAPLGEPQTRAFSPPGTQGADPLPPAEDSLH